MEDLPVLRSKLVSTFMTRHVLHWEKMMMKNTLMMKKMVEKEWEEEEGEEMHQGKVVG